MDNQKFGNFITELRKEKGWTQKELANKLNVTNKAVSRWERGLGFPDINTIEPLADALDVSVLEMMHAEKMTGSEVHKEDADDAMHSIIDVAYYSKIIERRNRIIVIMLLALIILGVFLFDNMPLIGIVFVVLPNLFLIVGLTLLIMAIYSKKKKKPYKFKLMISIFLLLFPLIVLFLLILAFPLGALGMS